MQLLRLPVKEIAPVCVSTKSVVKTFRHVWFQEAEMKSAPRFRVLNGESNEDACLMMKTLLGFSGVDVESRGTSNEVLQLVHDERFDLYLLDTRFPDGDGFELCRQIHEIALQTPIIFYSGYARSIDKERGIAAGADAYLVKPNCDEVVLAIEQLVKAKKVRVSRDLRQPFAILP